MVDERGGWFVVNVRDARWYRNAGFGTTCIFEKEAERFEHTGVRLAVLEPGKPNCRYHRESDLARGHGAEAPEPTPDPKVAYADAPKWEKTEPPTWSID